MATNMCDRVDPLLLRRAAQGIAHALPADYTVADGLADVERLRALAAAALPDLPPMSQTPGTPRATLLAEAADEVVRAQGTNTPLSDALRTLAAAVAGVTPESYDALVCILGVAEGEPSWYTLPAAVRDGLCVLRLLAASSSEVPHA